MTVKKGRTADSVTAVDAILEKMVRYTRILETKRFIQHGRTSVFSHSVSVAYFSLRIARFFRLRIDETSLIRGALFHDYFLYDWHNKTGRSRMHGFVHPEIALANARKTDCLNAIETDIIRNHMFPLTSKFPRTKEGFLVSCADKICSVIETCNLTGLLFSYAHVAADRAVPPYFFR
ncbi:metal-dependent phosphohydrolase HD sub domain-containing protein [Treponema brennaborense]|uniref:Metal-dependent phosphohydrolase HD sub domain protein n=1 Tax=Treponema brennaborense (strain DSM 12168 / CIP 105900 / DD5/3) TaxID=906968 RepID=F4LM22_TREBD|nr:metal-dependent phosphohydrolase HD sub domain-containing protein [Treponema brennaborense]AEE16701.1 metal-dependent phosphohydrolase HD sub domain protein [Treponema brennaborense DSM 12168]